MTQITGYIANFYDTKTQSYKPIPAFKGDNGITPHIGINGNWFIGNVDTGANVGGVLTLSKILGSSASTCTSAIDIYDAIAASTLTTVSNNVKIVDNVVNLTDTPSPSGVLSLDVVRFYDNSILSTTIYATFKTTIIAPYTWTMIWDSRNGTSIVQDWVNGTGTGTGEGIEMFVKTTTDEVVPASAKFVVDMTQNSFVSADTIRYSGTTVEAQLDNVTNSLTQLTNGLEEQVGTAIENYLIENPPSGGSGSDGFSPIANVTAVTNGAKITITDKVGTTTVNVMNGTNGLKGSNGVDGISPVKGVDYYTSTEINQVKSDIKNDLTSVTIVPASSNIYTIDFFNQLSINRAIITTDTVAKTITVSNVPMGTEMYLELVYLNESAITWFSGIVWLGGSAPTLTAGKTYRMAFFTENGGTVWHGISVGGW